MFYEIELRSHIRVHPTLFDKDINKSILAQLNNQFENLFQKT